MLGPRFGKSIKEVSQAIEKLSDSEIHVLENNEVLSIKINNQLVQLSKEDVQIKSKDIEGWIVAKSGDVTVALDIQINQELIYEGIARELINRIQNYRKDSGFDVTDKIIIYLEKNILLEPVLNKHIEYIKIETLALEVHLEKKITKGFLVEFDNIKTQILIKRN